MIQTYTGPGFYLSGGLAISQGGNFSITPSTSCTGGTCAGMRHDAKPTPMSTPDEDLSPGRIYAARLAACTANPPKPEPADAGNILTSQGGESVYQSRREAINQTRKETPQ